MERWSGEVEVGRVRENVVQTPLSLPCLSLCLGAFPLAVVASLLSYLQFSSCASWGVGMCCGVASVRG